MIGVGYDEFEEFGRVFMMVMMVVDVMVEMVMIVKGVEGVYEMYGKRFCRLMVRNVLFMGFYDFGFVFFKYFVVVLLFFVLF